MAATLPYHCGGCHSGLAGGESSRGAGVEPRFSNAVVMGSGLFASRSPGMTSQPRGAAVGARVVRRLDAAVARVFDQHAGVAAGLRIRHAELLDVVAEASEAFDDLRVEPALHLERRRGLAPGAAEQPARRVEGVG